MSHFKRFLVTVFVLMTVAVCGQNAATPAAHGPVVIELFTAEGCSSCPPADRALAQLQTQHTADGAELILLGEHVDYWNQLGWTDRFSTHSLTERQEQYSRALNSPSVYTPELIVDGHIEINGGAELKKAIADSAAHPKPAHVSLNWTGTAQLQISVEQGAPNSTVFFFITEDNLTTAVKAGENGGTTLHHAAVVRDMRNLGEVKKGSFHDTVTVAWNPEWQRKQLHFLAIVQQQHGAGEIVGAAAVRAPE